MSDKKIKILFPHQTDFLNYSQKECYNKDGFLLFHSYGEGKTITSLSWAMNYPNKKINIIIPKIIKEQWDNEISKIVPKKNVKNIKFIEQDSFLKNPSKFSKQLKENLLIFDEAHNICEYFNNSDDNQNLSDIINILKYPSKLLLLSATPIIDSILDLSLLVNICAKKKTMNISKKAFYEKYGNINESKKKKINRDYNIFRGANSKLFKTTFIAIIKKVTAVIIAAIIAKTVLKYKKIYDQKYKKTNRKDSKTGETVYLKKKNYFECFIPATGKDYGPTNIYERDVRVEGDTSSNPLEMSVLEWFLIFTISSLLEQSTKLITLPINKYIEKENNKLSKINIYDFYELNYEKIINDSFKYVNIHSNFIKYPSQYSKEIIYLHEYSLYQNFVIMDLIFDQETPRTYKLLQIYNENNYKQDKLTYKKDGIKVSNLNKIIYEIILKNIKVNQKKYFGFFINNENKFTLDDLDSKTKLIIRKYIKKKEKTVIYSNFLEQGIKNISIILNYFNIKHYVLDDNCSFKMKKDILEKFNKDDNSIKLLLINEKNLSGVNLKEVKLLHILEPIITNFKRKKLLNIFENKKNKLIINSHIFKQVKIIHTQKDDFELQIEKINKDYQKNLKLEINEECLKKSIELKKKNSKKNFLILEWLSKFGGLFNNIYKTVAVGDFSAIGKVKKDYAQQDFEYAANNKNSMNNKIIKYIKTKFETKNKKEITKVYNLMAYVEENKTKLNLNIDENIYLLYLEDMKKINVIYKKIYENSNQFKKDTECKQRKCSIWTPTDDGTCKDMN